MSISLYTKDELTIKQANIPAVLFMHTDMIHNNMTKEIKLIC